MHLQMLLHTKMRAALLLVLTRLTTQLAIGSMPRWWAVYLAGAHLNALPKKDGSA